MTVIDRIIQHFPEVRELKYRTAMVHGPTKITDDGTIDVSFYDDYLYPMRWYRLGVDGSIFDDKEARMIKYR